MTKSEERELDELRIRCEMVMASKCVSEEKDTYIRNRILNLGTEYTCNCEDPFKWDKDKCIEYLKDSN